MPLRSQNLIPLTSGAYKARNNIASYEICENCFPEINPENITSPTPVTHYPREGLVLLSSPPVLGPGRGIFTLSNGQIFAAVGEYLYRIDPATWDFVYLGTMANLTTPISMADNGTSVMIVDGSPNGYEVTAGVFSTIVDGTGTFMGSNAVSFSDTYIAFSTPFTNEWGVTNPNSISFNALQVADKDSKPDPIITLAFNLRVMWLLGAQTTEVWFDAGLTPFPYQEWPNIFIPYGCASPYSLTQADVNLFWISNNLQGQAIALSTQGYAVKAISTRALEYEWSTYPTVADVIGGSFQQAGHTFVVFHFPSADKSWAYDLSTQQWHQRVYIDNNGVRHREKVSFYCSVGRQDRYPTAIVGQDWATGQLYQLTPSAYTDNGQPIVCRRSFPHQMQDMQEVTLPAFIADFATGEAVDLPASAQIGTGRDFNTDFNDDFGPLVGGGMVPSQPALCMRYSKDGGHTWSNFRQKRLITSGNYRRMMRYRSLGMGRDWIFELLWVYPGPSALQGAYIPGPIPHGS